MIRVNRKVLAPKMYVAVSGGVDSIAGLMFLSKRHDVTMLHIDHGDIASEWEIPFVKKFAKQNNLQLSMIKVDSNIPKGASKENFWRNQRYAYFQSMNAPVVTCHHLDDCVESWIWSCMHGNPSTINWKQDNVVRPFLQTTKDDFVDYCKRGGIAWVHDETNDDSNYARRNYIRNTMMPHVLHLNPGIRKVVGKILEAAK